MMGLNKGPGPFLDIAGGFSFYAVYSAVKLNLFETLGKDALSTEELAERLGCTERGFGVLLEMLDSLGYVQHKAGRYANTKMTAKWMLDESSMNFAQAFRYYGDSLGDLWPDLHGTITSGRPKLGFYDWLKDHPDASAQYQEFMSTLARMMLPDIAKKIVLRPYQRKLLDIGGGHGMYSIALCRKYDDLTVTIFDSAYSRPIAAGNIEEAGLQDRIQFKEGNYYKDDLGTGYDVALLFNVLHEHCAEESAELVRRASQALTDRGCLIVLDMLREKKPTPVMNLIGRLYSLIFFLYLGGQNHSFNDISSWLASAGFNKIKRVNLTQAGVSLIVSQK
jgi:2-polyprenyl-3-methyl-5-hydroxy-6-metoxy-1,4-benzoquinol methylase